MPEVRLTHLAGARRGATDVVPAAGTLIGRDPAQCQVLISEADDAVSRVHAHIWSADGRWWIVDRTGRGATTVNARPATDPLPVDDGAVIGLGPVVRLAVHVPGDAAPRKLGGLAAALGGVVLLAVGLLPGFRASWEPVLAGLSAARRQDDPVLAPAEEGRLSEPPLAAAIRRLITDLSGQPYRCPIPDTFVEEVRDELVALHRTKRSRCPLDRWRDPVREVLREEVVRQGQPASRADALVYLAWVESNFEAEDACSFVGARGMWQFMPGTARDYGLVVAGPVDARCHWVDATRAAATYLGELFSLCGPEHPLLAIAGYNTGGKRSCAVAGANACEGWDFRGFYVRGTLHDETTEYVPRFVASWLVGEEPELALTEAQRRDATLPPIPGCPADDAFAAPAPRACATPATACADTRRRTP